MKTLSHITKFEAFLEEFCKLYSHIISSDDEVGKILLKDASRKVASFEKLNTFMGLFGCLCLIIYPYFTNKREHPFTVFIPGVDTHSTPVYEIIFIIQFGISLYLSFTYTPLTNFFVAFVIFGTVLLKILQHKFRNISSISECELLDLPPQIRKLNLDFLNERRFRLYIEYHKRIIQYVNELNKLFSTMFFVELCLDVVLFSGILYSINVTQETSRVMLLSTYISVLIFQLFQTYWTADELTFQVIFLILRI